MHSEVGQGIAGTAEGASQVGEGGDPLLDEVDERLFGPLEGATHERGRGIDGEDVESQRGGEAAAGSTEACDNLRAKVGEGTSGLELEKEEGPPAPPATFNFPASCAKTHTAKSTVSTVCQRSLSERSASCPRRQRMGSPRPTACAKTAESPPAASGIAATCHAGQAGKAALGSTPYAASGTAVPRRTGHEQHVANSSPRQSMGKPGGAGKEPHRRTQQSALARTLSTNPRPAPPSPLLVETGTCAPSASLQGTACVRPLDLGARAPLAVASSGVSDGCHPAGLASTQVPVPSRGGPMGPTGKPCALEPVNPYPHPPRATGQLAAAAATRGHSAAATGTLCRKRGAGFAGRGGLQGDSGRNDAPGPRECPALDRRQPLNPEPQPEGGTACLERCAAVEWAELAEVDAYALACSSLDDVGSCLKGMTKQNKRQLPSAPVRCKTCGRLGLRGATQTPGGHAHWWLEPTRACASESTGCPRQPAQLVQRSL